MTLTTPAQERSPRFSCPHPPWARGNRPGAGHIAQRSGTGTSKHRERLRCPLCHREGAEREGPWMARSTLPEAPVERRLPCQRGGIWDAGPTASGAVALKTVYGLPRVAPQRAQPPPQPGVWDVVAQSKAA